MQLNGFEVRIFLRQPDGTDEDLEEFGVKAAGHQGTANICSVDGAQFGISVKRLSADFEIAAFMVLDGCKLPRCKVLEKEEKLVRRTNTIIGSEQRASFRFSSISAEEASLDQERANGKGLGTIEVRLFQILNVRQEIRMRPYETFSLGAADEKALKERKQESGIPPSHQISLSDTVATKETNRWRTFDFASRDAPLATFTFTYGSRAVFEACGMVPAPDPVPTSSNVAEPSQTPASGVANTGSCKAENLDEEQTDQLSLSQHESIAGDARRLKREAVDESFGASVKRERRDRDPGLETCIDLTNDDLDGESVERKPIIVLD